MDREKEFALDDFGDNEVYPSPRHVTKLSVRFAAVASLLAVVLGYIFGYMVTGIRNLQTSHASSTSSKSSMGDSISSSTSFVSPVIKFYNNYTVNRPLTNEYTWDNIVEPYRITYFEVSNPIPASLLQNDDPSHPSFKSSYSYHWYVDGWDKDIGQTMTITFSNPPGTKLKIQVVLKHFNPVTNELEVISKSFVEVIVKYVRREIRSLFDRDREAFFNAISIMQRVPTQTGYSLTV
jgi:hypothetical protein